MKKINPALFKDTKDAYELHGDLNYPTFMRELMLKPIKEVDHFKGKAMVCLPMFNEAFYERVKKQYNNAPKKINWHATMKVLVKDLVEWE